MGFAKIFSSQNLLDNGAEYHNELSVTYIFQIPDTCIQYLQQYALPVNQNI